MVASSSTMKASDATSSFLGGGEQWPPGFRFHPTDEELVLYYLKRKICGRRLQIDVIAEVDVYKADPDELPGLSQLKSGDRQWFFFSPRDRKYPHGGRSNRATRLGYWKATGKDRTISCNSRSVGIKKTLVFYIGRAPSGERTDWVMHEYTLDEEELKRCPAKDYYVLYKVFKKSGAGPKNGEQYGAPFREEDWADDEEAIDCADKEQVSPVQQFNQYATSVDNFGADCLAVSQINGLELLNRFTDDPLLEPISELFGAVQPAGAVEDTHCALAKQSLLETNVEDRAITVPSSGQFNVVQTCFNLPHSTSSQFGETSDVACATNVNGQGSHGSEEDIRENFLEIDDLTRPEPSQQNMENTYDDLQIENFNGLCELDLLDDVSMFLQDAGYTELPSHIYDDHVGNQPCDPIPFSFPYTLENDVIDQVPNSCLNDFPSETVQPISQPYHNTLGNEMVYQFNNPMPHDPDVANHLWMHNQNFSMATPAVVPNQGSVIPPTSGAVYAGVNENQFQNQNQSQNQVGYGNEGGESWFSSTLWSFVETIPTTPASAAESTTLVNKALERLPNFGRKVGSVKVIWLNTSASAGNPIATRQRSRHKYNWGFFLFSLLSMLCAFLWVFTGLSMRVLGRCLS